MLLIEMLKCCKLKCLNAVN
ncbi:hypothetical protein F383_14139 [Gossypium arboreum]|uniref:Uncharacterized protein n=1 Tax=Gossypium arboreum TaxID=29729 RepID=A0A0B0MLF1_GOSAR|nr:hypothetical protein F383_38576 [Gossypium arboreum]KHF99752.1 hypothetical protein F383_38576 [Gossypium arboreum]KHG13546.1 hypothetical protein F383_18260 [Gossypium arboreum]KHG16204.1 hypothetical protein F383_00314 [Gossypium arboreum]KHG29711.1 hypothetical protein F383_14139 [Gossypium arboreum]